MLYPHHKLKETFNPSKKKKRDIQCLELNVGWKICMKYAKFLIDIYEVTYFIKLKVNLILLLIFVWIKRGYPTTETGKKRVTLKGYTTNLS